MMSHENVCDKSDMTGRRPRDQASGSAARRRITRRGRRVLLRALSSLHEALHCEYCNDPILDGERCLRAPQLPRDARSRMGGSLGGAAVRPSSVAMRSRVAARSPMSGESWGATKADRSQPSVRVPGCIVRRGRSRAGVRTNDRASHRRAHRLSRWVRGPAVVGSRRGLPTDGTASS